jgi:hypothetical protein
VSGTAYDTQIQASATQMIAEGRQTFRFDTFGDEAFWGDQLRLHQAIAGAQLGGVGAGVSPKTSLVGVTPRTSLAQAAGLDVDPRLGIHVNPYLETSAPDVWAAGDATCFFDPVYDRIWHVEHLNNAAWHGEIAGANMAGDRIAYDHVPNFFSDFLGYHMELFGDTQNWQRTLLVGEPAGGKFSEL